MSKSVERRLRKDAIRFANLASANPALFKSQWNIRVQSWTAEITRRGGALRALDECTTEQAEKAVAAVFGIFDKVNRLLTLCGPVIEEKVGDETRDMLSHACSQAVAHALKNSDGDQTTKWQMRGEVNLYDTCS